MQFRWASEAIEAIETSEQAWPANRSRECPVGGVVGATEGGSKPRECGKEILKAQWGGAQN